MNKTLGNNILDTPEGQDLESIDFKPNQLVSLLDVKKYLVQHIKNYTAVDYGLFYEFERKFHFKNNEPIQPEVAAEFNNAIDYIEIHLKFLKLRYSYKLLCEMRSKLASKDEYEKYKSYSEYLKDVETLSGRIDDEMEDITFGFIPKDKTAYFEQEQLFGKEVYKKFPDAREEIKEAGNCFAHDLNTACVFHLMRAAEIAVKEMYKQMAGRKTLIYGKDKTTNKPLSKPIELCDWQTLITGLNLALDKLEKGKSRSLAKHKTHSFYSEAIGMFKNLKDGWRNTISHGHEVNHDKERKLFKAGETEDIIRDTKRFMQRIATRMRDTDEKGN